MYQIDWNVHVPMSTCISKNYRDGKDKDEEIARKAVALLNLKPCFTKDMLKQKKSMKGLIDGEKMVQGVFYVYDMLDFAAGYFGVTKHDERKQNIALDIYDLSTEFFFQIMNEVLEENTEGVREKYGISKEEHKQFCQQITRQNYEKTFILAASEEEAKKLAYSTELAKEAICLVELTKV